MSRAFERRHCYGIKDADLLKQFEVAMDTGKSCIQSSKVVVQSGFTDRVRINLSHLFLQFRNEWLGLRPVFAHGRNPLSLIRSVGINAGRLKAGQHGLGHYLSMK